MTGAFEVFPIVVDRYAYLNDLPGAHDAASEVCDLLAGFGGVARPWPQEVLPGHDAVLNRLAEWSNPDAPRSSTLLWFGHGESDGGNAWLAVHGSHELFAGTGTAINPATFAEHLAREWQVRRQDPDAWAIVVVEACGAATFVRRLAHQLYGPDHVRTPDRLALIGVGADDGQTFLGDFADGLRRVVSSYTAMDHRVEVSELFQSLRTALPGQAVDFNLTGAMALIRAEPPAVLVGTTMDEYPELRRALRALPADQRDHFVPRAQGGERGEIPWYFTGRIAEQRRIAGWLRDTGTGSLLILTGRPGSGKSALLGQVLVQSDRHLRQLLVDAGIATELPADLRPPDGAFDAVIHLTGLTVADIVARLRTALDPDVSSDSPPATHPLADTAAAVADLLDRIADRPFTLLLDALDEAVEPITVAESLIRRLARVPRCRIVVGTRTGTTADPDHPRDENRDLLDALIDGPRSIVLPVSRDPDAIERYVGTRLTALAAAGKGSGRFTERAVAKVASLIRGQGREFLFAQLAIHEIAARPTLLDPDHAAGLESLLAGDHRDLFRHAVQRLRDQATANEPLLHALALARGRGLPRAGRIWEAAAKALAPAATTIDDREINRVLADAAPYIRLDTDRGQSVYRLAHRTFQEHFLTVTPPPREATNSGRR
ncbi:AAA family ATPase [Micromonospora sp. LOL_021]|uniref:AAA family ATPase n=1 Tax=Micromonospora sp. LOL_021 TaxID=3345417 RepID=UPI003A860FF6